VREEERERGRERERERAIVGFHSFSFLKKHNKAISSF
jgi:hypothetical protein